MKTRRRVMAIVAILFGIFPVFLGSRLLIKVIAQTKDHLTQTKNPEDKVVSRPSARIEPLELVDMRSDAKRIEEGKIFHQNGDWLKDFSVTYKNNTGRRIVSANFDLAFPETRATGGKMYHALSWGTPRMAAMKGERGTIVEPGETFVLRIDENEFTRLKKFIERRQSFQELSEAELTVSFLYFDDGTGWSGQYRILDPTRPGVWIEDPRYTGVRP